MKKRKLLYVQWKDHWTRATSWVTDKEVEESPEEYKIELVDSVGWVIKETKEALYLSPVVGGDSHRLELCIIKSCITKRKPLSLDD